VPLHDLSVAVVNVLLRLLEHLLVIEIPLTFADLGSTGLHALGGHSHHHLLLTLEGIVHGGVVLVVVSLGTDLLLLVMD